MLIRKFSKTTLFFSLTSILLGQSVAAPNDHAVTGWVEDPNFLCHGYYLHPAWEDYPTTSPVWKISADAMALTSNGQSTLTGDVTLDYGARHLSAETLTITRLNGEISNISAPHSVQYEDPDLLVQGTEGHWTAQPDLMEISEPHYFYFPRHARGQAHEVTLEANTKLTLEDASYTTCAPGSTAWELQGKEIVLNRDKGYGQAKHIRLKLANHTIFYWPYLHFPIDNERHSGFLYPSIGSTTQSGTEISWPYYWNLAPNYDLTITPRVLTARGVELQNEFRYLTKRSDGILLVNFLPNDERYRNFRRDYRQSPPLGLAPSDPRVSALDEGNHRLGVRLRHHGQYRSRWTFDIDYTYVGDDNYFYDLENDLNSANTTKLAQEVSLRYDSEHWQHTWRAQSYELLHPLFGPVNDEDYRRLPQWAMTGHYPYLYGLDWKFQGEITHFNHARDPFTGEAVTQGSRLFGRPALTLPYEVWSGYIKPRIQADFLAYRLTLGDFDKQNNYPDNFNRVIPIFDVDAGLFFDKFYANGYQQTLEPRMYYLYVPYRMQNTYPNFDSGVIDFNYHQLFRDNRFSGHDRLGDAHQISVALISRVLNARAEEKIRLTLGEILYFRDRDVSLCAPEDLVCLNQEDPDRTRRVSPLIGDLLYTPNAMWYFGAGAELNPNHTKFDKAYISAQWVPHPRQAMGLNYYWMRRDPFNQVEIFEDRPLHQVDASMLWPLHRQWDFLAHYRYDIEFKRAIEMIAGLEYESCCLAFQLVGNRYLRPNDGLTEPEYANGVFFQVMFKGLSTFGSGGAEQKLQRTIAQYQPFARRNRFH